MEEKGNAQAALGKSAGYLTCCILGMPGSGCMPGYGERKAKELTLVPVFAEQEALMQTAGMRIIRMPASFPVTVFVRKPCKM